MSEVVRYVPLDARGWRLAMGLRPLDESKWIEVDARRDEELALKSALLADRRDVVVATRAQGDEASAELLDELMMNLRTYHPSIPIDIDPDEHPIVAASRLVQEDLCILVRSDQWRLVAASVCFPSRWSLIEKIGTTMDEIHVPVPAYDEELSRPTNALFDRLKPERSFWRLNWTILDSALLHQPNAVRSSPSGRLDDWSFRVERQTFRRLARTGAIVFAIRTYVDSLDVLCRSSEDFASNLLHALDTAPRSMQRYKGWLGVHDQLREILTGR